MKMQIFFSVKFELSHGWVCFYLPSYIECMYAQIHHLTAILCWKLYIEVVKTGQELINQELDGFASR